MNDRKTRSTRKINTYDPTFCIMGLNPVAGNMLASSIRFVPNRNILPSVWLRRGARLHGIRHVFEVVQGVKGNFETVETGSAWSPLDLGRVPTCDCNFGYGLVHADMARLHYHRHNRIQVRLSTGSHRPDQPHKSGHGLVPDLYEFGFALMGVCP